MSLSQRLGLFFIIISISCLCFGRVHLAKWASFNSKLIGQGPVLDGVMSLEQEMGQHRMTYIPWAFIDFVENSYGYFNNEQAKGLKAEDRHFQNGTVVTQVELNNGIVEHTKAVGYLLTSFTSATGGQFAFRLMIDTQLTAKERQEVFNELVDNFKNFGPRVIDEEIEIFLPGDDGSLKKMIEGDDIVKFQKKKFVVPEEKPMEFMKFPPLMIDGATGVVIISIKGLGGRIKVTANQDGYLFVENLSDPRREPFIIKINPGPFKIAVSSDYVALTENQNKVVFYSTLNGHRLEREITSQTPVKKIYFAGSSFIVEVEGERRIFDPSQKGVPWAFSQDLPKACGDSF